MLARSPHGVLGKIAVDLDRAAAARNARGAPGETTERLLASGAGWSAADVLCTAGPGDRPFEERHSAVSVAVVVAGSFQYRSALGRDVMTPGSMLLGNDGQCFECGHEHAVGDRCVAFRFAPDVFDRIAADAGVARGERRFRAARLPPVRESAALVARAAYGAVEPAAVSWEELAVELAAGAARLASRLTASAGAAPAGAAARVTRSVRAIERQPGARWTLAELAAGAGLGAFHYLRTFRELTGVTPHQFVMRARLREAAMRLAAEDGKVVEIALASGFDDLSNFNRAFRAEFGVAPGVYRRRGGRG